MRYLRPGVSVIAHGRLFVRWSCAVCGKGEGEDIWVRADYSIRCTCGSVMWSDPL